jgi:uncharacterized protein YdeI (YjbR/CyaY-like superfamily)
MPRKPENVDQYIEIGCGRCEFGGTPQCKVRSWVNELAALREIILASGLTEEIKWSAPCYTSAGKNILMLSALRDSVVISFFQGAHMSDPENILEKPGENSRFGRYLRFTDAEQINAMKSTIFSYIQDAINIAKSGKKVDNSSASELEYPEELIQFFETNPDFEEAFAALIPGRQRGYLLYFSAAKQSKTRTARIEKFMPKIFEGKGWSDR